MGPDTEQPDYEKQAVAQSRAEGANLTDVLGALRNENATLKTALEKIANSTCHEAQCWPLRNIARDALREIALDELTAQAQEHSKYTKAANGQS